ncbi:MAG: hypothetical protein COA79_03920 [Planctomycetota bacterium]|nr:MAG: hypothetical protein COA79_03920 [Planctomycetota bacterium]
MLLIFKFEKILFLFLICFIHTDFITAQNKIAKLKKGKIHKKVICKSDESQSYALYIPSNYDAKKKWPIIFGFSPNAMGEHPVILSKDGAEKYGYIVVGSNNSRNGPSAPINAAFAAMKKDVLSKYNVDEKRFYAIGFSGGSRVSLRFSLLYSDQFKGVIACGAFFSPQMDFKNKDVLLYGLVGANGFNFPEYVGGTPFLDKRKIPYWISVFDGKHQWPPKELVFNGIEFFEYYYRKQNKSLDLKFEKIVFDRVLGLMIKNQKQKFWMNLYFGMILLDHWFADMKYKDPIAKLKNEIEGSSEYKNHLKTELALLAKLKKLKLIQDTARYWKNLDDLLLMHKEKHSKSDLIKGAIGSLYRYSIRSFQLAQSNPKANIPIKQQKFFIAFIIKLNPANNKFLLEGLRFYAKNSIETKVKEVLELLKENKYKNFLDLAKITELKKYKEKVWFREYLK